MATVAPTRPPARRCALPGVLIALALVLLFLPETSDKELEDTAAI